MLSLVPDDIRGEMVTMSRDESIRQNEDNLARRIYTHAGWRV